MRVSLAAVLATTAAACAPVATVQTAAPDGIAIAQQVIAAERDFAALAEREGQWTAFRATATADALMFVPDAVNAQQWLRGRADPPVAVRWQPHRVIVSCDGSLAATTGAAQWPGGSHGYFTTIWQRQTDGRWRWIADFGERLGAPLANITTPMVELAECPGAEGPEPQAPAAPGEARGGSRDNTLLWNFVPGERGGLRVSMWIGPRYAPTILPGAPLPATTR